MNFKEPLQYLASNTVAIVLTSIILPGVILNYDFITISIAVLVLTFVNIVLKPLIKMIAIPINFVSLGLFNIVINAGLLYLVSYLVEGFSITDGVLNVSLAGIIINNMYLPWYWMLLLATAIISLINWVLRKLLF